MDSCNQKNSEFFSCRVELGGSAPLNHKMGSAQIVPPNTQGFRGQSFPKKLWTCWWYLAEHQYKQLVSGKPKCLATREPQQAWQRTRRHREEFSTHFLEPSVSTHPGCRLLRSSSRKCNRLLFLKNARKNSALSVILVCRVHVAAGFYKQGPCLHVLPSWKRRKVCAF